MSAQVRLEALKLAVAAGGRVPLAVEFAEYIAAGVQKTETLALSPKKSDDAPSQSRTKRGLNNG